MTFEEWWEDVNPILRGYPNMTEAEMEKVIAQVAWDAAYDEGCQDTLDEVFGHTKKKKENGDDY